MKIDNRHGEIATMWQELKALIKSMEQYSAADHFDLIRADIAIVRKNYPEFPQAAGIIERVEMQTEAEPTEIPPSIDMHRLLAVTQQNEKHVENLQDEIKRLDARCNAILQRTFDNAADSRDARAFTNSAMHYIKRLFEDVSRLPKQAERADDDE